MTRFIFVLAFIGLCPGAAWACGSWGLGAVAKSGYSVHFLIHTVTVSKAGKRLGKFRIQGDHPSLLYVDYRKKRLRIADGAIRWGEREVGEFSNDAIRIGKHTYDVRLTKNDHEFYRHHVEVSENGQLEMKGRAMGFLHNCMEAEKMSKEQILAAQADEIRRRVAFFLAWLDLTAKR